jgi:soluble lytic murein transglycosylase-like protein
LRIEPSLAAVALAICLPLACSGTDRARLDHVTGILRQSAEHLDQDERSEIATGLLRAEHRTGVDAFLLLAVAEEESDFRPRVASHRGALGLLQIRPATARAVARRHQISWDGESTLLEPSTNLLIGAAYLRELHERFGSWDLALTAYNQGPTRARRLEKRGRNPSSRYAVRVLKRFEFLRGEFDATIDPTRATD